MKNLGVFAVSFLMLAAAGKSHAQADWPSKPIKFVVPSAAGAPPDVVSRMLANELQKSLGQPIVIENKPGAAGNIGLEAIAKATPDGYTIGYGNVNTLAINRSLIKSLPFDLDKDIVGVSLMGTVYNFLVTNNDLPVKSVAELVDYAKKNPGKLSIGSGGNGTTGHLSGELFKVKTETNMVHVPYRGSPQAVQDLLGGQIHVMLENTIVLAPMISSGKVRVLGITAPARLQQYPDVPTMAEAGVRDLVTEAWAGVIVPKGTPEAILDRLNAEINKAVKSDAIVQGFKGLGAEPKGSTRKEFDAFVASETKRWAEVVKVSGAKLD